MERKWANSGWKGRTNQVYIRNQSTLPPALSSSEVNLQLIRKWGYTGRAVKIVLHTTQPLLCIHLPLPLLAPPFTYSHVKKLGHAM